MTESLVTIATSAGWGGLPLPTGALSVSHKPLPWVATAAVPHDVEAPESVKARLEHSGVEIFRLATARVQPGLDMWEPAGRPRRSIGIYEYVTSTESGREAYYESQYSASGPAMRELWQSGYVQRFVGFELLEDLVPTEHGEWDVFHVTELTVRHFGQMLFWGKRFDKYARAAGYGSVRELKTQWDQWRTKSQGRARIELVQ